MNDSRADLRSRLMLGRQNLSALEQANAAAAVRDRVAGVLDGRSVGVVAAYIAHGGEVDPMPSIEALVGRGWQCVLPVCGADASMVFCPWTPGEDLVANRYGIGEPTTPPIDAGRIDVVLVPGVGFDPENGARIGHGVGFYDRFFASLADDDARPERLALAHDLQIVTLPTPEAWDVPMHRIVTPTHLIDIDQRPIENR